MATPSSSPSPTARVIPPPPQHSTLGIPVGPALSSSPAALKRKNQGKDGPHSASHASLKRHKFMHDTMTLAFARSSVTKARSFSLGQAQFAPEPVLQPAKHNKGENGVSILHHRPPPGADEDDYVGMEEDEDGGGVTIEIVENIKTGGSHTPGAHGAAGARGGGGGPSPIGNSTTKFLRGEELDPPLPQKFGEGTTHEGFFMD